MVIKVGLMVCATREEAGIYNKKWNTCQQLAPYPFEELQIYQTLGQIAL